MTVQNNVTLIGNLVADLDGVYVNTKKDETMFIGTVTLAVNARDRADFIRIKLIGNRWEKVANFLTKGKPIAIQGHIQTGSFEDENNERHFTTDVIVDSLQLLGSAKKETAQATTEENKKKWRRNNK